MSDPDAGNGDRVIKSIPLCFSRSNEFAKLNMFQMPLRASKNQILPSDVVSWAYKKKADKYRLVSKAVTVQECADTCKHNVFVSDRGFNGNNRFLLGKIKNGRLLVRPIDKVYTFKPEFPDAHKTTKGDGKDDSYIKITRIESEEGRKQRIKTYDYIKKQEDMEPWVRIEQLADMNDCLSSKLKQVFNETTVCTNHEGLYVSTGLYTKIFMNEVEKTSLPDDLGSLPVRSIVENVLGAFSFDSIVSTGFVNEIIHQKGLAIDVHALVEALNEEGIFINGYWACEKDRRLDEYNQMIRLYVMFQLWRNNVFHLNELAEPFQNVQGEFLDLQTVETILESFARRNLHEENWVFKFPIAEDVSPVMAERIDVQIEKWSVLQRKVFEYFRFDRTGELSKQEIKSLLLAKLITSEENIKKEEYLN